MKRKERDTKTRASTSMLPVSAADRVQTMPSLTCNSLLAKAGTRTTGSTGTTGQVGGFLTEITPSELQGQFYCHS